MTKLFRIAQGVTHNAEDAKDATILYHFQGFTDGAEPTSDRLSKS